MIITFHGISDMHCNMRTDIRIAGETGYDGLEILVGKLIRYLDQGYTAQDLVPLFKAHSVQAASMNALMGIERSKPEEHAALLAETERLCAAAQVLGCPIIQLVGWYREFPGPRATPWAEVLKVTAENVAEIADIGKRYGVKFQLEPIAWSPLHSVSQSLQVIDKAGRDNVGLVIDFWHLTAGEATPPDDVAKLDGSLIYGVHFCDGMKHVKRTKWDEGKLRGYLPGEGEIPIKEWVDAVRATGFDGVWSCELYSPKHWEWDLWEIARVTKEGMLRYLN